MSAPVAVSFTLPGIPRGWARARKNGKRFFRDQQTAAFETAMGTAAHVQMHGRELLTGPLELTVTSIFPVPKSWSHAKRAKALAGEIRPTVKPDHDNLAKMTDALNGVVWVDDAQVVDGRSVKFYGDIPAMHVTVVAIPPQPQSYSRPAWQPAPGSEATSQEAWTEGR